MKRGDVPVLSRSCFFSHPLHSLLVCAILSLLFPTLLFPTVALGQENNFTGWDRFLNQSYVRNPDRQVLRSFRLPESWDAERMLKKAREHIRDSEYLRAFDLLHEVIETHHEQVFQVAIDTLDSVKGLARYVGAAELAHYILSDLSEEGRAAYADFVVDKAGQKMRRAVASRDLAELASIGETYGASPLGQEACSLLATFFLEQGNCEMAALYLKKILLFNKDPGPEVLLRLAQALDQRGDEESKERYLFHLQDRLNQGRLEATDPRGFDYQAFYDDLERTPALKTMDPRDWPMCGGDVTRARPMPLDVDSTRLTRQWGDSFLNDLLIQADPFYAMSGTTRAVPFRLIRSGEILIINDTVSTMAFNIYTGERLWHFLGPLVSLDDEKGFFKLEDYISFQDGYGFSRTYTGSTISSHLVAGGTVAGNKVLVNLHDRRRRQEAKYLDRQIINKAIPKRSLIALSLDEGKPLWTQSSHPSLDRKPDEKDLLERISIPSPPVVIGDHVICNGFLREGGINTFLLCFHLETGRLIWKMPVGIGQHELTMFNMEYKEFTTTPVSGSENVIVYCSNLGFVCALDALSGRIRWVSEYNTIPLPEATHFTGQPNPRPVFWANNPPVIHEDTVVVTPLDSDSIFAYDLHTGKPRWRLHARRLGAGTYPNLIGVHDDKFILSGEGGAVALAAENGSRQWRVFLPANLAVTGRGAMSNDRLFLPSGGDLYGFELSGGKAAGKLGLDYTHYPSNLFLLGEVIASMETEYIQLYFDGPGMLDQALTRMEQGSNQAVDLAFIGDMYRLNGNLEKAIAFYKRAMNTDASDPTRDNARLARIDSCLFKACLDYGENLSYASREEEALEQYSYAFETASKPERIVLAGLTLIDHLEFMNAEDRLLPVLDSLARRCSGYVYSFEGIDGLDKASIGFYVHLKRYRMAQGDPVAQVHALQAIIESYPEEQFEGRPARFQASYLVEALIEANGRSIYKEYDDRAGRELEAALDRGGVELLEGIAEKYPNAHVAGRAALEIARHYLDKETTKPVYRVLTDYLNTHSTSPQLPHALFLMSNAADLDGNPQLSKALKKRILARYADATPPWHGDKSYADLFQAPDFRTASKSAALKLPHGDYEVESLELPDSMNRLVQPEGDLPAFMESKALLWTESTNSLVLLDYGRMSRLWTCDLSHYTSSSRGGELLGLVYMQSLLTVVLESAVIALDLGTGQIVWEFDPGGYIMDSCFVQGLVCLITMPLENMYGNSSDSDDAQDFMLAQTLNPVTGERFWLREVSYSSHARIIPSEDVFCVSSLSKNRQSQMILFDPLTGATGTEPSGHSGLGIDLLDRIITPLPFRSPEGLVLIIASQRPSQDGRGARIKYLEAYNTTTNALEWSVCLDKWLVPVNAFMLSGETVVMYTREREGLRGQKTLVLIDLKTGKILERLRFGDSSALLPESGLLRDESLLLRGTSRTRNLTVSNLDFNTMDFRFKDHHFLVGDSSTLNAIVRSSIYAENGVIIPMDFSLRQSRGRMLWSQVLFVGAEQGRLLYALDVFWKDSNRIPNLAVEQYPVEVAVRDDAVLVLKHAMLYIIRGAPTGG